MHDDDRLAAESEARTDAYLTSESRRAWRGDWWEKVVLIALVLIVAEIFLGWRGAVLSSVLIAAAVILSFARTAFVSIAAIVAAVMIALVLGFILYQAA